MAESRRHTAGSWPGFNLRTRRPRLEPPPGVITGGSCSSSLDRTAHRPVTSWCSATVRPLSPHRRGSRTISSSIAATSMAIRPAVRSVARHERRLDSVKGRHLRHQVTSQDRSDRRWSGPGPFTSKNYLEASGGTSCAVRHPAPAGGPIRLCSAHHVARRCVALRTGGEPSSSEERRRC